MIDANVEIQQMIYTGGGRTKKHGNTGAFGVWSQTEGLADLKLQNEICTIMTSIVHGNESDYNSQYSRVRVLKEGAKPSGLFKKSYKDEDYEYKNVLQRDRITILQQSRLGNFNKCYNDDERKEDFQANPEKAPVRIGTTKLLDGRLLVVRIGKINKVYSNADKRNGNFFAHSLVFPKGTKIEDINLENIDWQYGLEDKYWKGEGVMAPEYLETTSLNKMLVNMQKKRATTSGVQEKANRDITEQGLLDLYKTILSEKDNSKRIEYKKQFAECVKNGANLVGARKLAYLELLNAKKAGKPTIDYVEVAESLDCEFCKFDELYEDFSKMSDTGVTYEEQKQLTKQLEWKMSRCDMSFVIKFAQSQKELTQIVREYERLSNPNNKESDGTRKNVDASFRFVTYCQRVLEKQNQEDMEM